MKRSSRLAADAAYAQRRDSHRVLLSLPLPPSTNALTKNTARGRANTAAYEAWIRDAGTELEIQRPGRIPGRYALLLTIQRGCGLDLGNSEKAVSDLLVRHGVIRDDSLAETIALGWDAAKGVQVELVWIPLNGCHFLRPT